MKHTAILTILMSAASMCEAQAPPQYTITTVAGSGTAGYAGDGGAATSAQLNIPSAAVFVGGNLYVADQVNNRIRYVTGSGTISTIAGAGTAGYFGDGNAANKAGLNSPSCVAIDSKGDVYIADTANHAIRFVTASGTISTVAGGFGAGASGDSGPAKNAQLNLPSGLALDAAGNLYIADTGNNRIRKIVNGTINTLAGNGRAEYSGDGGLPTIAGLNAPKGVAADAAGNVYIADTHNHRIRMVANGTITTIVGNGTAGFTGDGGSPANAELNSPSGVAVDSVGGLYIADASNQRVRFVANAKIYTAAGSGGNDYAGDGGPATKAQLRFPSGVSVDSNGNVYISDTQHSAIRLLTAVIPDGSPVVSAVENAADYQVKDAAHGASPNSFVSIYASSLGTASNPSLFPATSFQGIRVLFNGNAAPLYAVIPSANLINLVIPSELADAGTAIVNVGNSSGYSQNFTLALARDDIGLFKLSADPAHPNNGAVMIAGTAWDVMPASTAAAYGLPTCTGLPATAACGQPAKPGDNIVIYFTGGGLATSPAGKPVSTGSVAPADGIVLYKTAQTPTVTIGGISAPVAFSGIAPGTAAEYQLNTTVPIAVQAGDAVPVVMSFSNSSDTVTIAVAR